MPRLAVAELRLGRYNGHSTLSSDWQEAVGAERWAGSVEVSVTTLDALIARHGRASLCEDRRRGNRGRGAGRVACARCLRSRSSSSVPPSRLRATASRASEELGEYEFNLATGRVMRCGTATGPPVWSSLSSLELRLGLGPRGLRRRLREAPEPMTPDAGRSTRSSSATSSAATLRGCVEGWPGCRRSRDRGRQRLPRRRRRDDRRPAGGDRALSEQRRLLLRLQPRRRATAARPTCSS